jgi:hypothetical protein
MSQRQSAAPGECAAGLRLAARAALRTAEQTGLGVNTLFSLHTYMIAVVP